MVQEIRKREDISATKPICSLFFVHLLVKALRKEYYAIVNPVLPLIILMLESHFSELTAQLYIKSENPLALTLFCQKINDLKV